MLQTFFCRSSVLKYTNAELTCIFVAHLLVWVDVFWHQVFCFVIKHRKIRPALMILYWMNNRRYLNVCLKIHTRGADARRKFSDLSILPQVTLSLSFSLLWIKLLQTPIIVSSQPFPIADLNFFYFFSIQSKLSDTEI